MKLHTKIVSKITLTIIFMAQAQPLSAALLKKSPMSETDHAQQEKIMLGYIAKYIDDTQSESASLIIALQTLSADNKNYVLFYACNEGLHHLIDDIIRSGACVSKRGRNGVTPLHCAAKKGHTLIVRTLIRLGAQVNARENSGATPLHYAAQEGRNSTVKALVQLDANPNAADIYNLTPFNYAAARHQTSTFNLLVSLQQDCKDDA